MKKITSFVKTSILGGLVVILPLSVLILIFKWIFKTVTNIIQPLTNLILVNIEFKEIIADILVITIIILVCFILGVIIKTRIGRFIHFTLERKFLTKIPGYSLIKETVLQFFGNKKSPFSSVALVKIYKNESLMTGFITDEIKDIITIFVPTGPNPTSGNIYHLPKNNVYPLKISVEDAMRSIISCGGGSSKLLNAYIKEYDIKI